MRLLCTNAIATTRPACSPIHKRTHCKSSANLDDIAVSKTPVYITPSRSVCLSAARALHTLLQRARLPRARRHGRWPSSPCNPSARMCDSLASHVSAHASEPSDYALSHLLSYVCDVCCASLVVLRFSVDNRRSSLLLSGGARSGGCSCSRCSCCCCCCCCCSFSCCCCCCCYS